MDKKAENLKLRRWAVLRTSRGGPHRLCIRGADASINMAMGLAYRGFAADGLYPTETVRMEAGHAW